MLQPKDNAAFIIHVLKHRNMLKDKITLRPLQPIMKQEEQREPFSPVCYACSSELRKDFRDGDPLEPKLVSTYTKPKDKPI